MTPWVRTRWTLVDEWESRRAACGSIARFGLFSFDLWYSQAVDRGRVEHSSAVHQLDQEGVELQDIVIGFLVGQSSMTQPTSAKDRENGVSLDGTPNVTEREDRQDGGGDGRSMKIPFSLGAVDVASNVMVSGRNCMVCTGVGVKPPSVNIRFHLTPTMMSSGGMPCLPQLLVLDLGIKRHCIQT